MSNRWRATVAVMAASVMPVLACGMPRHAADDTTSTTESTVPTSSASRPESTSTSTEGSTTTATAPPATTTTTSTTADTPENIGEMESRARDALLVAADLGEAFVDHIYTGSPPSPPCGVSEPDEVTPPRVKEIAMITGATPSSGIYEVIRVYADATVATSALAADDAYLGCRDAIIEGVRGSLGEHQDASLIDSHVDEGFKLAYRFGDEMGVLATIRLGRSVLFFQVYWSASKGDPALPPASEIIAKGMRKAAA